MLKVLTSSRIRRSSGLVAGAVLALIFVSCSADSSDEDLAAAEARVSELEAEVETLRADLKAATDTSTTTPPTTTSPPPTEPPETTTPTSEPPSTSATTAAPSTTEFVPATYSVEEFRSVLAAAAQAWVGDRSSPTFDNLAAAAEVAVDSGLLGPTSKRTPARVSNAGDHLLAQWVQDGITASIPTVHEFVSDLTDYPGSDQQVFSTIDALNLGVVTPPRFASGTYLVGNEPGMVPPGRYVTESETPFDGCYWETLDSSGEIIANNFVNSGFRVEANVATGAHSVEFDRCGLFVKQ